MDIHKIITDLYAMPVDSKDMIAAHLEERTYPKGYHLLEAGKVEPDVFFLKKGIVRAYVPLNGEEITFWFGTEGATIFSMESYINDRPGYETVELMEESTLLVLKRETLRSLFLTDIHIANWGRTLAEQEWGKAERKIIFLLSRNATERYEELLREQPHLLQRIPLGVISSYLGITQVTLSRIRAKLGVSRYQN